MGWRITWGDQSWTEDDMLVGHVAAIMALQGVDDWSFCDPTKGPVKLLGVLSVFIARDTHVAAVDVLGELAQLPAIRLAGCLDLAPEPGSQQP